jgi:tetratricopeptide (TPR) repeat protein
MFELAGLHPGPEISVPAAASLAGLPLAERRQALLELTGAYLLSEHVPGRFAFHDLLRDYAAERAEVTGTDAGRRAAMHRMLDFYLHTALAAERVLYPHWERITPAEPGVVPEHFTDQRQASNWFETERPVLIAAIALAADANFDLHAWQLPMALMYFLDQSGHWQDYADTQRTALVATQRAGNREGQAHAYRGLGGAYFRLGNYEDAYAHLCHCLEVFQQMGDTIGRAHTHLNLACLLHRLDRCGQGLIHAHQARELYEGAGQPHGLAASLNTVGWFEGHRGNHKQGLAYCQQGLTLYQELGDRLGAAATWDSLGYLHHLHGQHAEAVACYQHAITLYAELDARWQRAEALVNLGEAYDATDNRQAARELWRQALETFDELHHPDAERVRTKLDGADT